MKNIFLVTMAVLSMNLSISSGANADSLHILKAECPEDKVGNMDLRTCNNVELSNQILSRQQMKLVNKAIDDETNSWPDSILEGDVDTNFENLKIESIQSVSSIKDHSLIGYSVKFSYLGWETGCVKDNNYDRTKPETYCDCQKGRIRAVLFLEPDLKNSEAIVIADLYLFHKP